MPGSETPPRQSASKLLMTGKWVCVFASATAAFAQFGSPFPGAAPYPGVPGGPGYPQQQGGISMPRRGKNGVAKQPTDTVTGRIQRISTTELVLETEDKRLITCALEKTTQYFSGANPAKFGDFDTGDRVTVDAADDTTGHFHAVKVTLDKKAGTDTPGAQITQGDQDPPPTTTIAPKEAPRDPDDPGPPALKRGKPVTISSASRAERSQHTDPVPEPEPPPVRRTAPPPAATPSATPSAPKGDPVIAAARESALNFTETLPNYQVKQFTTRYQTDASKGDHTQWQALDVVTSDVLYEDGKENYKNIQINGKPAKDKLETTGSWSRGEFAAVLSDILSPYTDADFFNKRSATLANRTAWRYDYTVEQSNSHWEIMASAQTYYPSYRGSIWVDKETSRVLRIEMNTREMPKEFPLDKVESAVEYGFVQIGEKKFLLPTHSESLSCISGTPQCSRNVIDFRNYRRFGADTEIRFDPQ